MSKSLASQTINARYNVLATESLQRNVIMDDVLMLILSVRWIKYEEDVEEGADRWGKPHVSSLSFHSLLDLRKCIEQGIILSQIHF